MRNSCALNFFSFLKLYSSTYSLMHGSCFICRKSLVDFANVYWAAKMRRWRKKIAKKAHGAVSKNLNCDKNDSLTYLFYFGFLLPIVAI